ncbi:MAG: hypothetical protein U5P10_02615 [Spirochaetia bacterium]|nr:hypothetical protein [Spirochaetia bacterium]
MEEMKFAHSGVAEETERQIELGRMLAADYIVFGEIVDMAPQLLISIRVTGVDSGEVVYQDNVTERPGRYEYISGYFASKILDHFDVRVARSTEKKVEEKEEKQEAAVVAFSRALAAYDTGEKEEAKKELVEAKRIDPDYEAVQTYLDKLTSNASRFKVMPEHYLSFQNPAYLGIIEKDYLSFLFSRQKPVHDPTFITNDSGSKTGSGESSDYGNIRYSLPILPGWGAGLEFIHSSIDVAITGPEGYDHNIGSNYIDFYNLILASGFRLSDTIAVGIGGSCMLRSRDYYKLPWDKYKKEKDVVWGAEAGILLQFLDDSLFFDSHIAYSSNWFEYYRVETDEFDPVGVPLIFDNSLTYAFNRKRSYLTLGQQNQTLSRRGQLRRKTHPRVRTVVLGFIRSTRWF